MPLADLPVRSDRLDRSRFSVRIGAIRDQPKHRGCAGISQRHQAFAVEYPGQYTPYGLVHQTPSVQDLSQTRSDPAGSVDARTEVPALGALRPPRSTREPKPLRTSKQLGQLLYLSAGVTKKVNYPGGTQYFRAASCTGALYAFELYIVCGDLNGLDAGVYHFGPGDLSLRRLREGDYRGVLAGATGNNPAIAGAAAVLICTGTYWRNAWKYQARTYRHFGWDNGTIVANTLAVAKLSVSRAQVTCGFIDADVNRLLDLDTEHEVAFSMIPLGSPSVSHPESPRDIPPQNLETVPLSESAVQYPQMTRMHEASSLGSIEEVVAWRGHTPVGPGPSLHNGIISLLPPSDSQIPKDSIETVVLRRGSTRQFDRVVDRGQAVRDNAFTVRRGAFGRTFSLDSVRS